MCVCVCVCVSIFCVWKTGAKGKALRDWRSDDQTLLSAPPPPPLLPLRPLRARAPPPSMTPSVVVRSWSKTRADPAVAGGGSPIINKYLKKYVV